MYQPDNTILRKYADLMVNFALGEGKGIKKGDVVSISVPECARPFLTYLHNAVLEAGGHPVVDLIPDGLQAEFFARADEDQLGYRPKNKMLGQVEDIDHRLHILADDDKYELKNIEPKKVMDRFGSIQFYREALFGKEDQGNLTWTMCMYGTQSMASDVGLTLEEYWGEIIHACYLDYDDPIAEWKKIFTTLEETRQKLDDLEILSVHAVGEDMDLVVKLGEERRWKAGSGCNIPSYELFTSPDWRGTQGWIRFNQPLYYMSNVIRDVSLKFEDGIVVEATASSGEGLLKQMIAKEGANKAGEYSLTDGRVSRITKFMGETLYDENVGGRYGNTHLALGMAYKDCYRGDVASTTKEQWEDMGYNDSVVHTDIMSTTDRTVTATCKDGREVVIYRDGKFQI